MSSRNFLGYLASITILVLLAFGVLKYLHIPVGTLVDWVIGIAICWWLIGVVTLPWNTHFAAKQVLEEAKISTEKNIPVKAETIQYAQKLASRFFWIAIGLHVVTAFGLYLLAYYQITVIGYAASIAALGLTLLRPAQRAYEHLSYRLQSLSQQIRYPREDVAELQNRLYSTEKQLKELQTKLNVEEKDSWAFSQVKATTDLQLQVQKLELLLEEFTRQNQREHESLARQTTTEIAKLSEDAQFLNQVRELIRFVRNA